MKYIACYLPAEGDAAKLLHEIQELQGWGDKRGYAKELMRFHPFFVASSGGINKEEYDGMLASVKEGRVDRIIAGNLPALEKDANWTILLLTCKNSGIPVEISGYGEVEVRSQLLDSLKAIL